MCARFLAGLLIAEMLIFNQLYNGKINIIKLKKHYSWNLVNKEIKLRFLKLRFISLIFFCLNMFSAPLFNFNYERENYTQSESSSILKQKQNICAHVLVYITELSICNVGYHP